MFSTLKALLFAFIPLLHAKAVSKLDQTCSVMIAKQMPFKGND